MPGVLLSVFARYSRETNMLHSGIHGGVSLGVWVTCHVQMGQITAQDTKTNRCLNQWF